jgi:hypothetical protein
VKVSVSGRIHVSAACHSKGGNMRELAPVKPLSELKELKISRVRFIGPATLNVIDLSSNGTLGNSELLSRSEVYADRLISIAKCGIIDFD